MSNEGKYSAKIEHRKSKNEKSECKVGNKTFSQTGDFLCLNIRYHIDTSSHHPHRRIRTKSRAHNIISQKSAQINSALSS